MLLIFESCKEEPIVICRTPRDIVNQKLKTNKRSSNTTRKKFDYILSDGFAYKRYCENLNKDIKSDGINSYEFGKIHVQEGTRPQTFSKSPYKACEFYNMNKSCCDKLEIDVNKNVVISGNYETNRHTLQDTAIPIIEPDTGSLYPTLDLFNSYKPVIMAVIKKLRISQLSSATISDIDNSYFNPDTQPGFTQQKLCKNNTKRAAYKTSRHVARSIFNQLDKISNTTRKNLVHNFVSKRPKTRGLYTIGARNKRDFTYDNLERATSRVVHMPEFHNEMVFAPWLDEISELIMSEAQGPIYIGNSIFSYERFQKDLRKRSHAYVGDWKKYDSTYRIINILIVVCIARLYYETYCKRADVHFYFLFYNLAIKDYLQPGGNVTRIFNGLPSGSKCTSLFNSIYNCFALLKIFEDYDYSKINLAVGGDDFVVFSDTYHSDDQLDEISMNAKDIGMKLKYFDRKDSSPDNILDFPFFYKYSVKYNVPVLSPDILLERILMPFNLRVKNTFEYLEFLDAQIPLLGHPTTSLLPFYALYSNVYNTVHNRGSPGKMRVSDVFNIHNNSYLNYSYTYRRRLNLIDHLTFKKRSVVTLSHFSPTDKMHCNILRNMSIGLGHHVYKILH